VAIQRLDFWIATPLRARNDSLEKWEPYWFAEANPTYI